MRWQRRCCTAGSRSPVVTGSEADDGVAHVLGGFAELPLHPDVAARAAPLARAGVRLVPLTNGATALSERMLAAAGLLPLLARRLSRGGRRPVEAASGAVRAMPSPNATSTQVSAMLVAVHPWDAQRGALRGPAHRRGSSAAVGPGRGASTRRTCVASGIDDLADQLLAG